MGKITLKLIKYFLTIISAIILVCFIASSTFLSKFYMNLEYTSLKNTAEELYNNLKANTSNLNVSTENSFSSAVLVKNNSITYLTQNKMGMMPFLKTMDFKKLQTKGTFKNPMNEEFLYYKHTTDLGDIIVLKNNKFSSSYLNIAYIILLLVFVIAVLLSIPLISHIGKKFTKPILQLKEASKLISEGNFNIDISVNTKDEIEDLSNSIKHMTSSLEHKDTLQRNFIANVSHDFKTPLSVIRSFSEAIYDDILDAEGRKTYSKDIINEVDKLNLMVMDLMELSKLQGGNYTLNKSNFNLKELLLSFKDTFRLISENKNIELNINSLDAGINADPKQLYRVLYNFIDNALKFSPENSKVEVSADFYGEDIKVSVKDYGVGIKKEMLTDIWQRYYKHSSSGGMGLGLAICSEILKLHHFSYGVTSTPNVETEFYFTVEKTNIL